MIYVKVILPAFVWLIAACPAAVAQATAEYGLGAGRAATTAAPARNLGKGIAGVFDNLNKAAGAAGATAAEPDGSGMKKPSPMPTGRKTRKLTGQTQVRRGAGSTAATEPGPDAASAPPPQVAPRASVYEDASQIQPGIGYDELIRRFGPPSMAITTGPGKSSLLYSGGGGSYQVDVENGKVIAPQRN